MEKQHIYKFKIFSAMFIFGTIGAFVRSIPLPSDIIALARGAIGTLFLVIMMLVTKKRINFENVKKNFAILFISGVFLGANWILLFEAYRFTTVATATLCYYLGPSFVILLSPFVFKERLTLKKIICVILSFVGMIFVSGILDEGITDISELTGVILGVLAAILYAGTMIFNKQVKNISVYDKTVVQLFVSAITLIPYCLIVQRGNLLSFTPYSVMMLVFVGIVHTGLTYYMYFGSIEYVNVQTTAILSYIDPVTALLLSVLVLNENMTFKSFIGAVLIIGAAILSEINVSKKEGKN